MSVEIATSQVSYIRPKIAVEHIRQAHGAELDAIARYRRVTNYLAAAQIYLKQNVLLEEPLKPEHIKDRLLGHWGTSPGINLVGIGDNLTLEVMAAAHILHNDLPELRVRVVNVTDLFILEKETAHPHGLDDEMFEALFTPDTPVIINFHEYPSAVKQLLFGRNHTRRFHIHGYQEEGTTTTPFDMNVSNGTSRYHLITQAIRLAAARNPRVAARASERIHHYEYILIIWNATNSGYKIDK